MTMLGSSCSPCCFSCNYNLAGFIEISYRGRDFTIPATGSTENGQRQYNYFEPGWGGIVVTLSQSSPFSPFFGLPGALIDLFGIGTRESFVEICNPATQTLTHLVNVSMTNTGEGLPSLCDGSDGEPGVPLFSDVPVRQILDFKSVPRTSPLTGFDTFQQQLVWNWPDPYNQNLQAILFQQLAPGVNMFPVRVQRTRSTGTFRPPGRFCNLLAFETTDLTFTGFPGITKAEIILP
jgi:hypothetical protein